MNFALHPEAIEDLDEIHAYISQSSFGAANRFLDDIFSAFDSLSQMPRQGHRRPDLTSHPLRFKVVGNYLIVYAPEQKPLWIAAVVDGRRSPRVIAAMLRGRDQHTH